MARWIPDPNHPVGANEPVGRRLFTRDRLRGAQEQAPRDGGIELYHFEEKSGEVSLDRLGRTSIEGVIRKYLEPRARWAATRLAKPPKFLGWAVIRAKDLQAPSRGEALTIVVSPEPGSPNEPLSLNPYHAHIDPKGMNPHMLAVYLQHRFENEKKLELLADGGGKLNLSTSKASNIARLASWIRQLFHRG
jgi:hypothetical protein